MVLDVDLMRLHDYLVDKESVSAEVGAFSNPDALTESKKGKLACTPYRLVFVNGTDVTDISIQGVNSIEYSEPKFPRQYLGWGTALTLGGLLIMLFGTKLAGETTLVGDGILWVGGFIGLCGLLTFAQGYLLMRSTLKVHTPNKTYTFASDENGLEEIGHTVRGYEMQK